MKIVSWNVNGIRAAERKGLSGWLPSSGADLLGLQEIKASEGDIPPPLREPEGYHAFFAPCLVKKGYSGVALYSRQKPDRVVRGMGIPRFDDEGRIIAAHFGDTVVFVVYFPNGGGGPERLRYKLDFYDAFLVHLEHLRKRGKRIVFMGDVNTAHEAIDLARPKENEKNTGFLPEERAWIDEVIYHGYVDTFRSKHPNKTNAYSYWDMKTAARERNVGWRIDYVFVSSELSGKLVDAGIAHTVLGSDHCPVWAILKSL